MSSGQPCIELNGQLEPLREQHLGSLLARLGHRETKGVAVALNEVVIPRSRWDETALSPGDRIELVVAVQGG